MMEKWKLVFLVKVIFVHDIHPENALCLIIRLRACLLVALHFVGHADILDLFPSLTLLVPCRSRCIFQEVESNGMNTM